MRIHNVTISGFGPFRRTEVVDFDAFDTDGIFLITGRTGAGKTSILDAVSFALFGSVPRYDGNVELSVRSSFLADDEPCRVCLEFTIRDARYRVTRSTGYLRAKSRGEGMTPVKPSAQLEQLAGGEWEVLETQVSGTQDRVNAIVRLNAAQFRQVVLLAQGQFQEFLVANSDERSKLLRLLFGTERFVSYRDSLHQRAKDLAGLQKAHHDVARLRAGDLARLAGCDTPAIEPGHELLDWTDNLVAGQDQLVAEALSRTTALAEQRDAAHARFEEARDLADRQARRARELARKALLDAEVPSIDADRLRLERARKAELAAQAVNGWRDAAEALVRESDTHKGAELAYLKVWPSLPHDPGDVSRTVDDLSHEIGYLSAQIASEESLGELENQVESARAGLSAHEQDLSDAETLRVEMRAEADTLGERLESLRERAGRLPMAELILKEADDRRAASVRAEDVARQLASARIASLEAGQRLTTASQDRNELRARQLAGYAGVLAESLVAGRPCAVCGASEHPNPAALSDDHVGESELAEAEELVQQAIEDSRAADAHETGVKERLASETARCAGLTVAEAETQHSQLAEEVAALQLVVQEAADAQQQHDALSARVEELNVEIEHGNSVRGDLLAAQAAAEQRLAEVSRVVERARGEFASVAARLANVEARCSAGQRLVTAQQALAVAGDTEARQRARLAETLTRNGFDTADDVDRSTLAIHDTEVLAERINAHDVELAAVAMALGTPELCDLPTEPVDPTGPAQEEQRLADDLKEAEAVLSAAQPVLGLMHGAADDITTATRNFTEVQARSEVVARLAASIRGDAPNTMNMELEAFVLAAELEDIVAAANTRLKVMTSGRYELQHSDARARRNASSGLALTVLDAHTGEARLPESLSGGEKFQASLALALGLAEVVTSRAGGLRLDTLFIDEGFGSLDSDTLEATMATLDSLREGGRTIGLISHVEALRETIPAQLKVTVVSGGWSKIEQPGTEPADGCSGMD